MKDPPVVGGTWYTTLSGKRISTEGLIIRAIVDLDADIYNVDWRFDSDATFSPLVSGGYFPAASIPKLTSITRGSTPWGAGDYVNVDYVTLTTLESAPNTPCRVFRIQANTGPVALKGFTVTGGYVDYDNSVGGGIAASGSSPIKIADCMIKNNIAVKHGGGIHIPMWRGRTGSIAIEDCIVNANQCGGEGGGIRCFSYDGFVMVSRCLITHNSAAQAGGIMLGTQTLISDSLIFGNEAYSTTGGGIRRGGPGGGYILNCTITANTAATFGGGVYNPFIYNSIVCGNSAPSYPDIGPGSTVNNSCSPDLIAGNAGNINADPLFVNATGDYRLLPTSPCIDAGTNAFVWSAVDLDWNPRITDGDFDGSPVIDMGAFEFQITEVRIDIKPGSDTNPINFKSKGRCPVAVLTTEEFDAGEVNPSTVRFAGAAPVHVTVEDSDAHRPDVWRTTPCWHRLNPNRTVK